MKRLSRDMALPLFFYLAVTLGAPLAGNGYVRRDFSLHAATLLLVATVLVAAHVALRGRARPTSEDM
jgi:hypothetical protein